MAGIGRRFRFHGSFKRKWQAVEKEQETPGSFIREAVVKRGKNEGQKRYLVLTERKG